MRIQEIMSSARTATMLAFIGMGLGWDGIAVAHEDDGEEGHLIQHQVGGLGIDGGLTATQ